ncbi:hypothetical protein [Marinilabilia salmonicolor]|uniref:hypothetical protein n=1 Tax=Marinilabilia salmonicolor TaxID=989 RepID=UPI000299F2A8|nr:hypothetical protein [Marinilabilia salmonicolor]
MALKVITDIAKIDRRVWADFVNNHPNGNIFQLPWMYELHQMTSLQHPIAIFAFDGPLLVGLMIGTNFRSVAFPFSWLTRRQMVIGGPLVDNNNRDVLETILECLVKEFGHKAIFTEIKNLKLRLSLKPVFEDAGFYYESLLSVIVEMNKKSGTLWDSLSPDRRENIRRMSNVSGLIRDMHGTRDMENVWRVLRYAIGEKGLHVPHRSLFRFMDELEMLKPYVAIKGFEMNEDLKAVLIVMKFQQKAYFWMEGHCLDNGSEWMYDGFVWQVIQELESEGIQFLNMGDAGRPGNDFHSRQYKKSYGGTIRETGRYIYVHKWGLWNFRRFFYRWYKQARICFYKKYCSV